MKSTFIISTTTLVTIADYNYWKKIKDWIWKIQNTIYPKNIKPTCVLHNSNFSTKSQQSRYIKLIKMLKILKNWILSNPDNQTKIIKAFVFEQLDRYPTINEIKSLKNELLSHEVIENMIVPFDKPIKEALELIMGDNKSYRERIIQRNHSSSKAEGLTLPDMIWVMSKYPYEPKNQLPEISRNRSTKYLSPKHFTSNVLKSKNSQFVYPRSKRFSL